MSVSIQLTILVIKMNDAEIQSGLFIAIVQMVTNKVLEVDGSIVLIWTNVPQTVTISVTKMPGATILMDHMNVTVMLATMEMVSHAPISTNVNKIKVRDLRSESVRVWSVVWFLVRSGTWIPEQGVNFCDANSYCDNTEGSWNCECFAGFRGDGQNCLDIDECHEKSDNCNLYAECINHEGTFDCECLPGFDGDGVICNDIDECENAMSLANANGCPYNNQCVNTLGTFYCECENGFVVDSGGVCGDMDECTTNTHFCHPDAFCTNTGGQYYCTCKDGYEGNGKICNDRNECNSGEETCSSKNGFYEGLSF